jgi:hypothetical protein
MVRIVWVDNQMPIYLCAWHVLRAWCLHSIEKIKDNEVRRAILDDLHTVMYMPIKPSENIEAFMTCGKKKSLKTSPNIFLVIHGFDIFGPIISKLVCELIFNPLLLFHHVVHVPKYSLFELR